MTNSVDIFFATDFFALLTIDWIGSRLRGDRHFPDCFDGS